MIERGVAPSVVGRPRQLLAPLVPGELVAARALATLDDGWTVYVQPPLVGPGLGVPVVDRERPLLPR